MKLYLYITDIHNYLSGNITYHVVDHEISIPNWVLAGSIDFDADVDIPSMTKAAVDIIETAEQQEIAGHEVKMGMLKEKKANLLSITHQPLEVA